MAIRFETFQRSAVAVFGALIATMMLVVASAPHVPLA